MTLNKTKDTRCTRCKHLRPNDAFVSDLGTTLKTCIKCRRRNAKTRVSNKKQTESGTDESDSDDASKKSKIIETIIQNNNHLLELLKL